MAEDFGTLGPPVDLDDPNNSLTGTGAKKEYPPAIYNPPEVKRLLNPSPPSEKGSGGYIHTWNQVSTFQDKTTGESKQSLKLNIFLEPGTYVFQAGDCISLVGYAVKDKKSEKASDIAFKIQEPYVKSGFKGFGFGGGGGGFNSQESQPYSSNNLNVSVDYDPTDF